MSDRITDLDRAIAKRLRAFRVEAKLTQPQVASHLGIAYQSYQKMERGSHSFRASTLDRLALLYNKRLWHFIHPDDAQIDPAITKATLILHGLSDEGREQAIRALINIKHGERSK
jgi:transcriptional regulator with XRE-family HTH domain